MNQKEIENFQNFLTGFYKEFDLSMMKLIKHFKTNDGSQPCISRATYAIFNKSICIDNEDGSMDVEFRINASMN